MEKLFKAKCLNYGEWHVFSLDDINGKIHFSDDGFIWNRSFITLDKNTICQYTGIKDIEGNRVFEGDELEDTSEGFYSKFFVEWDDEDASFDGLTPAWKWKNNTLTGQNIHDRG